MTALTDIGELFISDSREGGKDYLLRPSFEAMTRIGTPEEIILHPSDDYVRDFTRDVPKDALPGSSRSGSTIMLAMILLQQQ